MSTAGAPAGAQVPRVVTTNEGRVLAPPPCGVCWGRKFAVKFSSPGETGFAFSYKAERMVIPFLPVQCWI